MVVLATPAVLSMQALVAAQPCTILTGVLAFQGTAQALTTFQPTFEQVRLLAVAVVHLVQQGQSMATCCCPLPCSTSMRSWRTAPTARSRRWPFRMRMQLMRLLPVGASTSCWPAVASCSVRRWGLQLEGPGEHMHCPIYAVLKLRDGCQGDLLWGGCCSGGSGPHSVA